MGVAPSKVDPAISDWDTPSAPVVGFHHPNSATNLRRSSLLGMVYRNLCCQLQHILA